MKFIILKEQNQNNAGTVPLTVSADHIMTMRAMGTTTRICIGPHMYFDVTQTPSEITKLIASAEL